MTYGKKSDGERTITRGGFTLVELLVATAITLVLAVLLLTTTTGILSSWNRSRGDLMASNQAKLALDQLTSDLQSAVIRSDGAVWFAATIQPDQSGSGDTQCNFASWGASGGGTMKSGNSGGSLRLVPAGTAVVPELQPMADYRFGMAGVWLRFFTTEPDGNDPSDLSQTSTVRAVGYQIVRYKPTSSGSSRRYGLYRSWVRPYSSSSSDSTFGVGYELFADSTGAKTSYNIGSGSEGNAGSIRRPNANYTVANNVIDFGVRIWVRNSSGDLVVAFPRTDTNLGFAARIPVAAGSEPNAVPLEPASGAPTFTQMSYGVPELIEVFVRVLSDDGADQIDALESGKRVGNWWEIAEANSTVYTRRIEVKGAAALGL